MVSPKIQQLKDFAYKTNSQQVQNYIHNMTVHKTQSGPMTLSLEHGGGNYMDGILQNLRLMRSAYGAFMNVLRFQELTTIISVNITTD